MKIEYRTLLEAADEVYLYELLNMDICCNSMKEAIEERFISFGDEPDLSFKFEFPFETNGKLSIFYCRNYYDGESYFNLEIDYCPFCGGEIEYCELERKQYKLVKDTKDRGYGFTFNKKGEKLQFIVDWERTREYLAINKNRRGNQQS